MCHPVLRDVQVRAARVDTQMRNPQGKFPAATATARQSLGLLHSSSALLVIAREGLSTSHHPSHLLSRSFCWKHRPEQAVQATPEQNITCLICLDLVEDKMSYSTMVCPACRHAWFHRRCIQTQALHTGTSFCCLHCRNKDQFVTEMLAMGIRISTRLVFSLPNSQNVRHKHSVKPGTAPADLVFCCPLTLVLRFMGELENRVGAEEQGQLGSA